jgi:hypothetical protein
MVNVGASQKVIVFRRNTCIDIRVREEVMWMQKTVAEHIETLEQKRKELGAQIMDEKHKGNRNHLEAQQRAVESALTLYRAALDVEKRALM